MLLHPQVSVLVTSYAGQDVSVLGEVARPGSIPTPSPSLAGPDLAASGLSPNAGRLVNIFHRDDPAGTPHPVVLDPSGTDTGATTTPS